MLCLHANKKPWGEQGFLCSERAALKGSVLHQFLFSDRFIDDPISNSILGKIRGGENKFRVKRNLQMFACKQKKPWLQAGLFLLYWDVMRTGRD
jgi:hypothetical protein